MVGQNKMNKTKLHEIIKEELQAALKEATSTTLPLDDLKVVIDALGSQIERVREIGREAKENAGWANLGEGEALLRIARFCADASWKMAQAKKVLSDATQRREDKLALEAQRKDDE